MNNDEMLKHQLQTAHLKIVDQDNSFKQIESDGLTTAFTAQGLPKTAINFQEVNQVLQQLKQRGYLYVKSDLPDDETFDSIDDQDQISQRYQIVMRHATRPVNADNPAANYGYDKESLYRDVTRTVTYFADNGVELAPVVQHAYFDGASYLDEVTHKLVATNLDGSVDTSKKGGLSWSPDQEFPAIAALGGYRVVKLQTENEADRDVAEDGAVAAMKVAHNSQNVKLVITLASAADNADEAAIDESENDAKNNTTTQDSDDSSLLAEQKDPEKPENDENLEVDSDGIPIGDPLDLIGLSGIKKHNRD
ncbi:mucin-binding protein [Lactobacillus hominis]|uniref:MucBP domain protein n=1 Tax=Lactobacillus hominis DSM 23910 = CRBIP 24.179 TaxID=1423758 RepID=I7IVL7_9LACO|nr:MucBP domain protein [Lactobacillus hominis]KRM84938.1 hypothetical protein FC41_GL001755 [Lactobacillus hominis DSM 23910 = CRBIP 24.179]MCT3348137.1 hypothetical protein [Lactobacillus hominis]CCI81663.1 MucBP domain protein [Lactobacillus hominis DSM 23910 = CRBIP 24.179]